MQKGLASSTVDSTVSAFSKINLSADNTTMSTATIIVQLNGMIIDIQDGASETVIRQYHTCHLQSVLGDIKQVESIYIVCGYTDMRRFIDSLAALVQKNFKLNPFSNNLFLFYGHKCDRLKVLYWEGY